MVRCHDPGRLDVMRRSIRSDLDGVTRSALVGVTVALFLVVPEVRAAASGTTPKEIVEKAVSEYSLGHFAESSALFEEAYQLDPAPILLFNVAQCQRHLGNSERALLFYRRYLEGAPADAPERVEATKHMTEIDAALREQAATKSPPPSGAERGPQPPPGLSLPVEQGSAPADSQHTLRILAWTTGAVAAGALVAGGVAAAVWSKRVGRFDDHIGPLVEDPTKSGKNCGTDDPNRGGTGCASLYDDMTSAKTWTIVSLVTAGVFAAGSAVLFLTSAPGGDNHTTQSSLACGPNPFSRGISCHVLF